MTLPRVERGASRGAAATAWPARARRALRCPWGSPGAASARISARNNSPGRGASPGPVARRGRDVDHPITLTLEEAHDGTTRRLSLETDGRTRRVEVKIPAGVRDGARVRLAGKGEPGTGGEAAGDLFLRVRQAPHATFTRRGQHLHVDVTVSVTTAVLGGSVSVPRLCGTPLSLKIPAATQSGQVFRLTGRGMPGVGQSVADGDLFAAVSVRVPEQLTAAHRRHYEALAALDDSDIEVDTGLDDDT